MGEKIKKTPVQEQIYYDQAHSLRRILFDNKELKYIQSICVQIYESDSVGNSLM